MMQIMFIIPGEAVGKGRPRAFRLGDSIRMHTPEKTARWENLVKFAAAEKMGAAAPSERACEVEVFIMKAPPASWSKKKQLAAISGEIRPTSKPDSDNVLKAIGDACNGVVWRDDAQVTDAIVRKRYATKAETIVVIREVSA